MPEARAGAIYQRILVPVDGSPASSQGLSEAIRLAAVTGGRIRLIHIVDELSLAMTAGAFGSADVLGVLLQAGRCILEADSARVAQAHVEVETALSDHFAGGVSNEVIADARFWRADLIVLGTHGRRGASRLLLGSDAEQIVRLAPVPVMLVRLDGAPHPGDQTG